MRAIPPVIKARPVRTIDTDRGPEEAWATAAIETAISSEVAARAVETHDDDDDDDDVIELSDEDLIAVRVAAWTEEVLNAQLAPAEAAEVAAYTRAGVAAALSKAVAQHLATFSDGEIAASIESALGGDAATLSPPVLAARITSRIRAISTHDKATTRIAALADAKATPRSIKVSTKIAALVAAAEGEKVTRRMAVLSYTACQRSRRAAGTIEPAALTPPAHFPTGSGRHQTRMPSLAMSALEPTASTDTERMSPLEILAAVSRSSAPPTQMPRGLLGGVLIAGSLTMLIGVIAALL